MISNTGEAFKRAADTIALQLVEEHNREKRTLYEDNMKIREELVRVCDMMNNFLNRERQLHDMLASLTDSHTSIAASLHGKVQEAVGKGHALAGDTKNKAGEMLNLHAATVQEIQRIGNILNQPLAQPGMPNMMSTSSSSVPMLSSSPMLPPSW
mmetsp:Transcript_65161/g.103210  ORF Transcript_65161/g.103210 Transcript_65161/m.103210 type:complete len:154 (+) Transcript_65161:68-529(+)|eukprot:CAMPEP_0169120186 /NCGR_PEP_ID=MMETSP1015-20121227/31961_1 /TAXON_ID=342587 /ORGANISM="Karlodinium micrum, Strain CCMP2283" /LENGTH=153 /DNA_ID=CAMNT_0009183127 /DNA_START=67 /DNA_END=528 /DNA_ORIENTATION=-